MSGTDTPIDGGLAPNPALLPASAGTRRMPGAVEAPAGLPAAWTQVLERDFTEVPTGVWGPDAPGPNGWRPVQGAWGSMAARFGAAEWAAGGNLESTATSLRVHLFRDDAAGVWRADGIEQTGTAYTQFHLRTLVRCSGAALRGIGFYVGLRPADGGWGSEWALYETPGGAGAVIASTVHADTTGQRNMRVWGARSSGVRVAAGVADWHVIDARRTFRTIAGQRVATCRLWLDGVECGGQDGLWVDNAFNVEPLVFTASAFLAGPGLATHGGVADATTPADSFLEIDYVRVWAPV